MFRLTRLIPRIPKAINKKLIWSNARVFSTQASKSDYSKNDSKSKIDKVHSQLIPHLTPKSTTRKIMESTTQFLGMSIGASSATIMYYLAANFGEQIASPLLGLANDPTSTKTLGIFLGACAYTSMAALSISAMNDIVKSAWQRSKLDSGQIFILLGYGILGALSAIPQSSLTLKEFMTSHVAIAWGLTISAFLGPLAFNTTGLYGLVTILKSHQKGLNKRDALHLDWLSFLKVRINEMSPEERLRLSNQILSSDDTTVQQRLQNFEIFCQETVKHYLSLDSKKTNHPSSSSTKGLLATIPIGFLAGVPYIKLGTDGTNLYAQQFNLSLSDASLYAVGIGGYIANGALASFAMQKRWEQIQSGSCKRKWVTLLTAPLGFIAATPLIYIAIIDSQTHTFLNWLVVGSVTIGTTMVRWGSLENLVNRIVDKVSNYGQPEIACKQLLLEKCNAIESTLKYEVSDEDARSYYYYLMNSKATFFTKPAPHLQANRVSDELKTFSP